MNYIAQTTYAAYIKERENAEVIENSCGFITYKISGQHCLILDTYILQSERRKGVFKFLFEQLKEKAMQGICLSIIGKIYFLDPNHLETLKAALSLGFKIIDANNECLTISLPVGGF